MLVLSRGLGGRSVGSGEGAQPPQGAEERRLVKELITFRLEDYMAKFRTVPKKDVQDVVDKMFELFSELGANSDTVFCALEVSLETLTEQFGYELRAHGKHEDQN